MNDHGSPTAIDTGETETEIAVRTWLAEQADLLTLEEGFDRAQLAGPYICVEPREGGETA